MTDALKKLREIDSRLLDPGLAVQIFEALPDAIFMVDSVGIIQFVNHQAELLTGYHRIELFDKPIEILIPEAFRDKHILERTEYFLEPRPRAMAIGLQLSAIRKNGEQFTVEINLSPIVTPQGIYVLAVMRKKR